MNAGKAVYKGKKILSCLMAIILVILSCNNTWAAEPVGYAVGDTFTEGDLKYRIIDEDNMYVEVSGLSPQADFSDGVLDIPVNVVYDGVTYSVTAIGIGAFYDNWALNYVNIPDSVTIIDKDSFSYCRNLQNVTIPGSVEKIGEHVFAGCSSFTKIIIPEGVKEIDRAAFYDCRNVDTISIPGSLETMGDFTFNCCGIDVDELTVTMKEGMKSIGGHAFSSCLNLKEIIIPSSVETIGESAFSYCRALENVIIKTKKITQMERDTFEDCESLKCIEIPNSVTMFYGNVFSNCTSLREMRIDINVKKEDKNPVTAISLDEEAIKYAFFKIPTDRKLVFLNSDGTKELAGTSLVAAQTAYKAVNDGDTTDNYWYGWEIADMADLYTVTVNVEKDGETWEDHGKKFLLKNKNGYLIDDFQAESGTYMVCVAVGETVVDTGVTVEVNDSDTSVTIEYFTVTFYDDTAYENDTIWGQQIVRKDDYAIKPGSDPEKADFKFAGWKTDKEGSEAFDFEAGITDTTSIYASWSKVSGDSTEPNKPSDTENPTEPGKPTDTENPPEPSKPSETENPTEPSKPADTENPAEPTKPSGTENPPVPSEPSGTENPPVPNKPSGTQKPTDSNNPTGLETPSTPSPSPNPNGSPELEEPEGLAPVDEAEKGEKPATGDTNYVEIYATAAMIAGLSYVMLMFSKRKDGMTEEEKNLRVSVLIEWSKKGSRVRKYVALTAIFFLLLYYHSIGKQLDLKWNEIYGE